MTDTAALDRAIQANLEKHLQQLSLLCSYPSVAAQGDDMAATVDFVAGLLRDRQFEVEILTTDGQPVLFAERGGQTDRRMLFYNHYDVQPPEPLELWESPPFELARHGDYLVARGVSDDKGHLICRLAAIDALLAVDGDLPCTVKFVIEGEEEVGSPHLAAFVGDEQERLAADACLWEFGGVDHDGRPLLYAGLRGIQYVELRVRSASSDSHSGLGGSIFPNAAWRLTWALASLKGADERIAIDGFYDEVEPPTERDLELLDALPDDSADLKSRYQLDGFIKGLEGGLNFQREKLFSPTCTICGLTSGYQGPGTKTVLPAVANAKVDMRLVPKQSPARVLELLRKHLARHGFSDIEVVPLGSEPPGRTDPDHPFLQMVADQAEEVYGQRQLIQPLSGGSGPIHPFIEHLGVPIATVGVSYPGAKIHAPNENIRVGDFVNGIRHTSRVMAEFGGRGAKQGPFATSGT
jgi:acetylornithine deacetylase/succinyl-diaminopimelate desuccinylase-like protein